MSISPNPSLCCVPSQKSNFPATYSTCLYLGQWFVELWAEICITFLYNMQEITCAISFISDIGHTLASLDAVSRHFLCCRKIINVPYQITTDPRVRKWKEIWIKLALVFVIKLINSKKTKPKQKNKQTINQCFWYTK